MNPAADRVPDITIVQIQPSDDRPEGGPPPRWGDAHQPMLRLLPHVHGTDGYFAACFEVAG